MIDPFYYIGIDVGLGGAIASFGVDGTLDIYDMPTVEVARNRQNLKKKSPPPVCTLLLDIRNPQFVSSSK